MNRLKTVTMSLMLMLMLSLSASAQIPSSVKELPVQYQGRVMPFASFAREQLLNATGKLKQKGQDPAETIMHWMALPESAMKLKVLNVGYEPLREEVGLDLKRRKFSLNELLANRKLMDLSRQAAQVREQEGKLSKIESEAEKAINRAGHMYASLTRQTPNWVPVPGDPNASWISLHQSGQSVDTVATMILYSVGQMIASFGKGDLAQTAGLAEKLDETVRLAWRPSEAEVKRFDAEVDYNRMKPIQLGRNIYLISLLVLLFSLIGWGYRLVPIAGFLLTIGLISHVYGMILRAIAGGRAPWSNFYESLVTLTAALVLFGLLLSKKKLRGIIFGSTAFAGFFALLIADRAGLSPGVDTLVPALQSYWLIIHVIVIMSAYAVATLAMVLGHVALGVEVIKPGDRSLFIAVTNSVYRSVQLTMLLLFAGTILGGVWAAEAWGRYWGWDPKETWALISWFAYLGIAHARFAGWLKPRGIAMAAIGVFPIILMTYYGVNYLLSGLHSYAGGESAGVPSLLIAFLIFEMIVLLVAWKGWHLKLNPAIGRDVVKRTEPQAVKAKLTETDIDDEVEQ